ncbi:MAG TPA: GTP 3',8-cyclase MoaA [Bacteroidales bacterium]|nr:GTP 3',8-cyclase MoaA [Bacteroidales bacterium]
MYDSFNRKINYLRISVTDRCNLRCRYCMPAEGIPLLEHDDILSFDEIVDFTRVAVGMGINKVRITGGEPLVRKGIVELTQMLASIEGIDDLGMTTNGIFLDRFAQPLADAGLHRVNISLDTLDEEKYHQITRRGNLSEVLRGIAAADRAGLHPIKLNCVVKKDGDEPDAISVRQFAEAHGYQVRYIPQMDLVEGTFGRVLGGEGGDCAHCNRLRLTSDGKILPCLFSNISYDIRELGAKRAIETALKNKPLSGTTNKTSCFSNIGG